jgi:hypothetical protein
VDDTVREFAGCWRAPTGREDPLSDDELTALALAADPSQPIDRDSVPIDVYLGRCVGSLPEWYMPSVRSRARRGWLKLGVLGMIALLLLIEALGLCTTYGPSLFPFR